MIVSQANYCKQTAETWRKDEKMKQVMSQKTETRGTRIILRAHWLSVKRNGLHATVVWQKKTTELISSEQEKDPIKRHISKIQTRVIRNTSNHSLTEAQTHVYSHVSVSLVNLKHLSRSMCLYISFNEERNLKNDGKRPVALKKMKRQNPNCTK